VRRHTCCRLEILEMATSSSKKLLPKRLEDELKNIPKYKPRTEPPRRTVADILGDSVERAAYDEIIGPLVNRLPSSLLKIGPNANISMNEVSSGKSESDFTTSLLTRLADAEEETKSLRKQILEKNARLSAAEHENGQLRAVVEAPSHLLDEINNLKSENFSLEKQIVDMEEFLHDYGLQWVGGSDSSTKNSREEAKKSDESSGRLNYGAFAAKIEELNSLLSSEPTQIKTDAKRGKIVHASELFESISVTVYSDGIMIRRGPFRDIKTESYELFVRDVMDGFFPSEFRDEFPDGVMFHLIDKHNASYVGSRDHIDGALSRDQLLGKVHKTVLKDGNIISVRQDLVNFIDGTGRNEMGAKDNGDVTNAAGKGVPKSSNIILKTAASISSRDKESDSKIEKGGEIGGECRPTASVQVRWLDGTILLAVLFADDCVGDIRREIERHLDTLDDGGIREYELRSAYPPRVLSDQMSLLEAGLIPNGTIHARGTGK
jgi:UBX domain-containing protein 11